MQELTKPGNTQVSNSDLGRLAMELHNKAVQGIFISAMAIKTIFDNDLYRELGFETKEQYAEEMLPYGFRTAQMYYKIADKAGDVFGNLLNINGLNLLSSESGLEETKPGFVSAKLNNPYTGGNEELPYSERVMSLGMRKLYTLCNKLEAGQLEDLAATGRCMVTCQNSGRTCELKEIEEMTAAKLEELFRGEKDKKESKPVFSFAQWVKGDVAGYRVAYWCYKKMLFLTSGKLVMESNPDILTALDKLGRLLEKHLEAMGEFPEELRGH